MLTLIGLDFNNQLRLESASFSSSTDCILDPMLAILSATNLSQSAMTFTVDRDLWKVTVPTHNQSLSDDAMVEIRGPHRVWRLQGFGWDSTCKLLRWPFPGPLIGVRFRSGAGHGVRTCYFTVRKGNLVEVLENQGEAGGPEFWWRHPARMVFDNYDYYNHWDKGGSPSRFLVYEILPSGKAKLRRTIPDPKNRRVKGATDW
jgi:hypothetical protein